jgi:hypothetical protein
LTRGYNQLAAATEKILDQAAAAENADRLGRLLHQGGERVDYSLDRESQAVRSAWDLKEGLADLAAFAKLQKARLDRAVRDRGTALGLGAIQPVVPPRNPEAEKIVVRRKRMGTITLDDLPREQREGYPAASFWGVPVSALYWCDGKRNLAEVIRLTQLEMGPQQFDFVGYFKFLEKRGYVEFVRRFQNRAVLPRAEVPSAGRFQGPEAQRVLPKAAAWALASVVAAWRTSPVASPAAAAPFGAS